MPEIKVNKSDNDTVYRCFLLNVRSHRDYVCLEIDNCPSQTDVTTNEEFSIDSSTLILPVLDKIRFNIKSANSAVSLWYKTKLEVFAEGNQIFPRKYCLKCESRIKEEAEVELKNEIGPNKNKSKFQTPTCSDSHLSLYNKKGKDNFKNRKNAKEKVNDKYETSNLKCRSEMLTIDQEYSNNEVACLSLPNVLARNNNEKAIQTQVCLGNQDFSNDSVGSNTTLVTLRNHSCDDLVKAISFKMKTREYNKNVNFIHSTNRKFKSFDINKKIRYWSLIKSARQMMKMNKDVIELNELLKTMSVEDALKNPNLLDSFSPVNLVLKLKKLNRSASLYSIINENSEPLNTKGIQKNLTNLKLTENDLNRFNYFFKLSDTLSDNGSKDSKNNEGDTDKSSKQSSSKESLLSMSTLFSMQKRMLRMMEMFLKKNSKELEHDQNTLATDSVKEDT